MERQNRVVGLNGVAAQNGAAGRQRGLTFVELLVGLAVAAVLAGLAAPGFAGLRRSVGLSAAANELLTALQLARSSAARTGRPVAVCLTVDERTCLGGVEGPASGWLVFHPVNTSALAPVATPESTLHRYRLPADITVSATRPAVTFWPVSRSGTTSTFHLCTTDRRPAGRAIVVSQTGRARVSQEATPCAV